MIKTLHCNKQTYQIHSLEDLNRVKDIAKDPNQVFWLDLLDPTEDELRRVGNEFSLHPLALEDASHEHQRPKIEQYDQFLFVVFYTAHLSETGQELKMHELNLFIGENYLITVHYEKMAELEEAEGRWKRNTKQLEIGIGFILYTLLDTIVDGYFPLVDGLVDRSEELEDRIFEGRVAAREISSNLLELKKFFLELRRIAAPERDVLNVLTNRDNPIFHEQSMIYFRDVYDHITRVMDTLDLYRDQLSSAMDANLAVVSNDLNQVMRTLTVTSIILMSVTLIASIYGMNFDRSVSIFNMPELGLPFGYVGALGLMLLIAIVLYTYFKRRNWL